MRRVLIGTPAYAGTVDVRYAHSLANTVRLCAQHDIDVRELFPWGDAIVQNARNDLVKDALDHRFDDLVFIDADQEWQAEDFLRLLSWPVDCVGFPVVKKNDVEDYNVKAPSADIPVDLHTGLLIVEALGTGFLRFSRKALLALWEASDPYYLTDRTKMARWIFDIRPVDNILVGEDVMVSHKLRALGIMTYLDPAVTISHVGCKTYRGDFAKWLARLKVERQQAAS